MNHVELSIKAKQLLEEGVMEQVFDALREDMLNDLLSTQPEDCQRRENIFWMLQALSKIEIKFANCCSQLDFEEFQRDNLEATKRRV